MNMSKESRTRHDTANAIACLVIIIVSLPIMIPYCFYLLYYRYVQDYETMTSDNFDSVDFLHRLLADVRKANESYKGS